MEQKRREDDTTTGVGKAREFALPRHAADRYALQKRLGFPRLRFMNDLEEEFRETFIPLNATRTRIANLLGILGVIAFILVDTFLGSNLEPPEGDWVLILATLPALLVPILATFNPRTNPHLRHYMFWATLIIGLSIVWAIRVGREANFWFPYSSLYLVTAYVYFVSGLLFLDAVLCGLVMYVAYLTSVWTLTDHSVLIYEAFYLFMANVIGTLGLYFLERESRQTFLLERELRHHAVLDGLTGLMNRRAFRGHLDSVWAQAQREGKALGIMLLDIDHFKDFNDHHGHLAGDACLMHFADVLRSNARRPLDASARYGGDELIAMWYDPDRSWFEGLGTELRKRANTLECADVGDKPVRITISGGAVYARPNSRLLVHDVLKLADDKLYEVKRSTRDGINYAEMPVPEKQEARSAA